MLRTIRLAASAAGLTLVAALALSPVALAAPEPGAADPAAPRSWSFWQSDGIAWMEAPGTAVAPKDQEIIGWRFAASPDGVGTEAPRQIPSFKEVCGDRQAPAGQKRVVLAVDFGDVEVDAYPGDTPPAPGQRVECVVAGDQATNLDLLSTLARPRVNDTGEIVALDGYPAKQKDSGTELAAQAPDATGENDKSSALPFILGGAGAVVAAGLAGLFLARRRRT